MPRRQSFFRLAIAAGVLVVAAAAAVMAVFLFGPERFVARFAPPTEIGLKSGNLTANLNGELGVFSQLADGIRFRANGGAWRRFTQDSPRLVPGSILLEVPATELVAGENAVDLDFESFLGLDRRIRLHFRYRPSPPSFPIVRDWSKTMPEVQDGRWARVETAAGWRLRPVPGAEWYDRLVLVAPPFRGPRRVSVDVTFKRHTGQLFGFGVIPLWGGHNDRQPLSPRRGWEYGIAWYYSLQKGFGVEFSQKYGAAPHRTVRNYAPVPVTAGETFRIVAEARGPAQPAPGSGGYRLRLRWENLATGHVSDWIELTDAGAPMPDKPYAVALVAHRAAVLFGPVRIERLAPR